MSDNVGVSTKKLKSMLKMLRENGVLKYKDNEIEIEFSARAPAPKQPVKEHFDITDYEEPVRNAKNPPRDDLGYTEQDYLNWSATP